MLALVFRARLCTRFKVLLHVVIREICGAIQGSVARRSPAVGATDGDRTCKRRQRWLDCCDALLFPCVKVLRTDLLVHHRGKISTNFPAQGNLYTPPATPPLKGGVFGA